MQAGIGSVHGLQSPNFYEGLGDDSCLMHYPPGQLQLAEEAGQCATVQVPVVPHVLHMWGALKLELRHSPAQALLPLHAPCELCKTGKHN